MALRLTAAVFDTPDPATAAAFWARLLDRPVTATSTVADLPGAGGQLGLRFTAGPAAPSPHRMHVHVTSSGSADQEATVTMALSLGARHLDVGQRPEEGHIVLADPAGYAFCVIEPHNSLLAGCGRLGELACDGTREVGLFWRDALGWPLVWDQDEETAIQSPQGGTKVAWGGPPVPAKTGRNPQRFALEADGIGIDDEVERLLALGARRVADAVGGAVELADPDGNEFLVAPGPR